jgi:hypothetical protein
MKNYLAYLDESGGHGFDFTKLGTPIYFVVCAVIIDEANENQITENFLKIKSYYFSNGELKSSSIGNKDHIRKRILNEVNGLDFKYYNLVVDKRAIYPNTGLQHKETFYKFLYGMLYNNLYRTIHNLSIVSDNLISDQFITGFRKYVVKNHRVDLFHQDLIFKESHSVVLLQLADLIGGTINRFYSGKSTIDIKIELPDKQLGEILWPKGYKPYTVDENDITDEFREVISDLALLRIKGYLDKNQDSPDPLVIKRVYFLNYIQAIFLYNSKTRFIYTDEILRHLESVTGEVIKEQFFRQQIIAPLRTDGILISSNKNGYKIPCSKADIYLFFNLFSKVIHPMINRLKISHEALFQATNGKFDVLDNPEYEYLRKLIE